VKLFVFLGEEPIGDVYLQFRRGRLTSTFEYAREYVVRRGAYSIDPGLPLSTGNWPVSGTLPRAFLDAAPDRWDVMAWEKTALDLAEQAGIEVPARQLLDVGGQSVLLVDRFDRTGDGQRVGYMSTLTLCAADDGDHRDYLEVAEHLAVVSAAPEKDLAQLWRRILFGLGINNTDDHLRNHGLLRTGPGWRLSPAFDLNPNPRVGAAHATSIGGVDGGVEAVTALMTAARLFGLTTAGATRVVSEVAQAVAGWRTIASRNGLRPAELPRFEAVFGAGLSWLEGVAAHTRSAGSPGSGQRP
jgi:serine/threonine-protein kinase HipA